MLERYVYKGNRKLRCGYTTGSCAAAAAKAAVLTLLTGRKQNDVYISTPKGIPLRLKVEETIIEKDTVSCSIKKDSGDDADVTNGILVYAAVKKTEKEITIDGGEGIGRVTKPGLDQKIGQAAINRVPKRMIYDEVFEVCEEAGYTKGIHIILSIPEGIRLAEKTFNPRLGITGGLSILGTTGIVEPMSESALVETIKTEISMFRANGCEYLLAVPGNYGETFAENKLFLTADKMVKCSNFIGETIDMAYEFQLKGLLFTGHIGKLVKLGGGIMNTHSKWADGRMEILCSCAVRAGGEQPLLNKILDCVTADEALELLKEAGLLKASMDALMEKMDYHLNHRAYEGLVIGAVVFSNQFGLLGKTGQADFLLDKLKAGGL